MSLEQPNGVASPQQQVDATQRSAPTDDAPTHRPNTATGGPFEPFLRLFSSIRLGIVLLTLLFIYCSVGSAGLLLPKGLAIGSSDNWEQLHIRQMRGLELTEFEWFHWWPFSLLMGLICLNVTVATLRRIPLRPVNFGVWMIHTGILALSASCLWYFGTKVEGDMLLPRAVQVSVDGGPSATMLARIGANATLGQGDDAYNVTIAAIDPQWPLLSGKDEGQRAYSVTLSIEHGDSQFMRQIIAGFPQFTEDLVRTDDPQQPFQRSVKVSGERISDHSFNAEFALLPQQDMYLVNTSAIYVREVGQQEWIERPIDGLPRYHDYISDTTHIWRPSGMPFEKHPLKLSVEPADVSAGGASDLASLDLRITDVLQYAIMQEKHIAGGETLDPVVSVRLEINVGLAQEYSLRAFDPQQRTAEGGRLALTWVDSEQQRQAMLDEATPRVHVRIEDAGFDELLVLQSPPAPQPGSAMVDDQATFTPIGDTGYAYRLENIWSDLEQEGQTFSVAMMTIRTPTGDTFTRWAADNTALNRDFAAELSAQGERQPLELDTSIETRFIPSTETARVHLLVGPTENDVYALLSIRGELPELVAIAPNQKLDLGNGVSLIVLSSISHPLSEIRPWVFPTEQRDRNVDRQLAMIGVRVADAMFDQVVWVPYHLYPIAGEDQAMPRFPYQPARIALSYGRQIELLFSRQRMQLPQPVTLDNFELVEHVGGFTGSTQSIRDWRSEIRFGETQSGEWSEPVAVSMNKPASSEGFSFFQAQWDPPDSASPGLSYTVLGVGNRNGVLAMLLACCWAVTGMIYAFYIKPIIKRRRQLAVHAQLAELRGERASVQSKDAAMEHIATTTDTGAAS